MNSFFANFIEKLNNAISSNNQELFEQCIDEVGTKLMDLEFEIDGLRIDNELLKTENENLHQIIDLMENNEIEDFCSNNEAEKSAGFLQSAMVEEKINWATFNLPGIPQSNDRKIIQVDATEYAFCQKNGKFDNFVAVFKVGSEVFECTYTGKFLNIYELRAGKFGNQKSFTFTDGKYVGNGDEIAIKGNVLRSNEANFKNVLKAVRLKYTNH